MVLAYYSSCTEGFEGTVLKKNCFQQDTECLAIIVLNNASCSIQVRRNNIEHAVSKFMTKFSGAYCFMTL